MLQLQLRFRTSFFGQGLVDVRTGVVNLQLLPVELPAGVADERDYVLQRHSEVMIAPDNEHAAWRLCFC